MTQNEKVYAKFVLQFQELMKQIKERDFSWFCFFMYWYR